MSQSDDIPKGVMTTPDRLEEIKSIPSDLVPWVDVEWLISEVERLRDKVRAQQGEVSESRFEIERLRRDNKIQRAKYEAIRASIESDAVRAGAAELRAENKKLRETLLHIEGQLLRVDSGGGSFHGVLANYARTALGEEKTLGQSLHEAAQEILSGEDS